MLVALLLIWHCHHGSPLSEAGDLPHRAGSWLQLGPEMRKVSQVVLTPWHPQPSEWPAFRVLSLGEGSGG